MMKASQRRHVIKTCQGQVQACKEKQCQGERRRSVLENLPDSQQIDLAQLAPADAGHQDDDHPGPQGAKLDEQRGKEKRGAFRFCRDGIPGIRGNLGNRVGAGRLLLLFQGSSLEPTAADESSAKSHSTPSTRLRRRSSSRPLKWWSALGTVRRRFGEETASARWGAEEFSSSPPWMNRTGMPWLEASAS